MTEYIIRIIILAIMGVCLLKKTGFLAQEAPVISASPIEEFVNSEFDSMPAEYQQEYYDPNAAPTPQLGNMTANNAQQRGTGNSGFHVDMSQLQNMPVEQATEVILDNMMK